MKKYIVREGDTMWKVSKATGVRLNMLMAANPQVQDVNQLQPGSVLSIPELGKESTGSAPTTAHTASAGSSAYAVKPAQSGVSASGSDKPVPASSSGSEAPYFGFVWPHVVKSGEGWESIAKTYNVPADSLHRMNPRQTGHLQAGDILYVPGAAGQVPGSPGVGQGHIDPTTGAPTSVPSGGTYEPQPQGWPMMPPAQAPGVANQPGGWPGMPQMPGYAVAEGPHTHMPYRSPWYDAMVLPPYPVYVPAPPAGRYAVEGPGAGGAMYTPAGIPPDVSYRMWLQSQQMPQGWNAGWDESSAWESSWSAAFPPDQPGFGDGGLHRPTGPTDIRQDGIDAGRAPDTWHWPDAFSTKDGVRDTPESSS